jgi:UDP-N-acetylmuramoylalanine--D-glutamate ligase
LSSFQLELFEGTGEHICGFLNISPDHLDRHGSMENYLAAKQNIFLGAKQAVVNRDDLLTFPQGLTHCDLVTFGTDEPQATDFGVISHNDIRWLALGKQRLMPVCDLSLKGTHNISNALAALALGHCAGLPMESMLRTLRHFRGLPHRCEEIANINNILYIDDSKATNIGAACAAIEGFSQFQKRNILLIAGGRAKNIDFSSLIKMVRTAVKHCFLLGEIADELHNLLCGVIPVSRHSSIEACVVEASKIGCAGDVVLLSPACASFDMFENYIERGLHFQAAVNSLSENGRAHR